MTKHVAVENAPEVYPDPATNPDPLTGEPGAHPVGTGIGAASGAATGAAVGAIGGPVGAAIGGVVGAVAGGLMGKGVAEGINPTLEDAYWRDHFHTRPYASQGGYEHYRDAYRYGWEARARYPETQHFADVQDDLQRDWERAKGTSRLTWNDARPATQDAWERLERTEPGIDPFL